MEFTCTALQSEQQLAVTLTGDVDYTIIPRLQAKADTWAGAGTDVVLDCSRVTFMDSLGIRVLIQLRQTVTGAGHSLILASPSIPVIRVLELAGLKQLFAYSGAEPEPSTKPTAAA